jgi:KaiC/GvpD/RAD55 family RecA-like ATPase
MRSLAQALRGSGQLGIELPEILPCLSERGILFRRAQMHLVAAQPGGGKTLFALWYALSSHVPTLYFSADSDSRTLLARAAAILSRRTVRESEVAIANDDNEIFQHLYGKSSHIRFDFNPSPSLQDIEEEILAYTELFGDCPELIIVDNLMNIAHSSDAEWTAMRDAMSAFHFMARETESAFLILHHVSESDTRATYPAPRKALQGKVSQLPEMVLTVAIDAAQDQYRIACVKNRHGAAYPNADEFITAFVDAERMTLFNDAPALYLARTKAEFV